MSYDLKQDRFSEQDIVNMKATLQRRQHTNLENIRLNDNEVFLMCENTKKKKCQFIFIFRRRLTTQNDPYFSLLMYDQNHSEECIASHTFINNPKSFGSENNELIQRSPIRKNKYNQERLDPHLQSNQGFYWHEGNKYNCEYQTAQKSKKGIQQNEISSELDLEITSKGRQSIYKEDQITALKKLLVNKYNALISKSIYTDPVSNLITKITFKCKYSQQNSCEFQQRLNLISQHPQILYKLQSVNCEHKSECIMDEQQLRFHQMTRKIDQNMSLIENIVQRICESGGEVRPKLVLEQLGKQLGEENGDFIYDGLQKRNHRRAVKKYFDNAVGKIRNKFKIQV